VVGALVLGSFRGVFVGVWWVLEGIWGLVLEGIWVIVW
jgi:hypothetical protein